VLRLLYVDVPSLDDETTPDDLIMLVRTFQWEDWRELRFAAAVAEGYRRRVAGLAARLVEANRQIEEADRTASILRADDSLQGTVDDSPGFLDQIATAEETLPRLTSTMAVIGREIERIGQVMQEATADIAQSDRHAKGFAARLLVARKAAQRLAEPAESIWSFGHEFASQLHEVDEGIRVLIAFAATGVQQNPETKTEVCTLFGMIRSLSDAAQVGLSSAKGLVDAIAPIEKMSRDLRPVLRRLRQGLTTMVEAREVSDEWVQLIDGSGIACED
jgi:hypothetical protein